MFYGIANTPLFGFPSWGNYFWAKGYCVGTVGLNADMIRKCWKSNKNNSILIRGQAHAPFQGLKGKATF